MTRTWPDTFGAPISDGYTVSPVDQALRTDMESGTSRSRRITKARRDRINAAIRMNDLMMEAFRVWAGDEYWSAAGDSDDTSLWTRTNFTRQADGQVGPDDALADRFFETTTDGPHKASLNLADLNLSGLSFNLLATIKAGGRQFARVSVYDRAGVENYAVFDLTNGLVSSSSGVTASIVSRGNGWWRTKIAVSTGTGTSTVAAQLALMSDAVTTSYVGDTAKWLGTCEICAHSGSDIFVRTDASGNAQGAAGGTAWFFMPLAVGKGVQQLEAKFTGSWEASALPGLGWEITMPLEVRNA